MRMVSMQPLQPCNPAALPAALAQGWRKDHLEEGDEGEEELSGDGDDDVSDSDDGQGEEDMAMTTATAGDDDGQG